MSIPQFRSPSPRLLFALPILFGTLTLPALGGLWSAPVTFQEFGGAMGGFPSGAVTWVDQSRPVAPGQSYDVLSHTGTDAASGKPLYAPGQDGTPDLTVTAQVQDFSEGRFSNIFGGKNNSGLEAGTRVQSGLSRSGDGAVVSLELQFDPSLQLTAGDFAMRLISVNGTSTLYEWTMVTVGLANQAPFDPARLSDYTALHYNNTSSGTFYDVAGQPTGNAGTGNRLGTGQSISQFLTNRPGTPVSGGMVQAGWYSIDDFNAVVFDSEEAYLDNPFPGDGALDDNLVLTGAGLGLAADAPMTAITIWFGYHDVAFDSDGDGYTATETNIYERVAGLTLGSQLPVTVPEPGNIVLLGLAGAVFANRRRKKP